VPGKRHGCIAECTNSVNSRQMVPSLGQGVEASDDSFEVAPGRARKEFDTVILAGTYVDDDEGRRLLLRSRHESDRTLVIVAPDEGATPQPRRRRSGPVGSIEDSIRTARWRLCR
jgi:hypothetical protein